MGHQHVSSQTVRCFFALLLDNKAKLALQEVAQALSPFHKWLKLYPEEKWHITLRFLGDCHAGKINPILKQWQQLTQGLPPFDINIDGTQWFPNKRKAHHVVMHVHYSKPLLALASACEQLARDFGFPAEQRPYRPHLSLGKIIHQPPKHVLLPHHCVLPKQTIAATHLLQSRLHQQGAIYREIAQTKLTHSYPPSLSRSPQ